ncbi:MAG: sigma-54-dependent transcriptional regulator [Gammaproteobacteria bacterium]
MTNPMTLIVDDEPDILELLEMTLNQMNIDAIAASDLGSAMRLLELNDFNLCLTDMRLPDGNGLQLVEHIQKKFPALPVAVITAHGSVDTAIKAMKSGAFDFVSKPVDLNSLRQMVKSALRLNEFSTYERRSRNTLLGESEIMRQIRYKISRVARSQAPVFISGESGSGKELIARLIHEKSSRSEHPFVAINCGAIPQDLMESEFFGHKKGSFTGAYSDNSGLFQAAQGGTLFLDEVADLPPSLQVKLLRAIQEKKIRPVGGPQEIDVDVRLLSATHKNLGRMVHHGEFRQDLFYRINVIELHAPPLRSHSEDIPQLAEHILSSLSETSGITNPRLSPDALNTLKRYHFPGNVRELENILERAIALYDGDAIESCDLNLPDCVQDAMIDTEKEFQPAETSLEDYLEDIEKRAIAKALENNKWNKTATAKQLGMTFRSLRYRLKKLGLE